MRSAAGSHSASPAYDFTRAFMATKQQRVRADSGADGIRSSRKTLASGADYYKNARCISKIVAIIDNPVHHLRNGDKRWKFSFRLSLS
jgi:hypothetical protein